MPGDDGSPSPSPSHQAVDRALQVISFLGAHPQGASLQEISAATGIPKPSLHRTLASMRERHFASQLRSGGVYLLGPAALEAAFSFHANLDIRALVNPLMVEAREISGQTVHLATIDGGQVVYLDKLEASIGVRLTSVVGGRNPAQATGVGKALLASQLPDAASAANWVAQYDPLEPRTPHTITTAAALTSALAEIRERGYAIDDEESEPGLLCVAAVVPLVFGPLAPPLAISITGLKDRALEFGVDRLGTALTTLISGFEFARVQLTRV